MFINALSWKKFNASKKKGSHGEAKEAGKVKGGLGFRAPLDNIHPIVDNNRCGVLDLISGYILSYIWISNILYLNIYYI